MSYAPSQHWDRYFSELHQAGQDLDWGHQWTGAFIKSLRQANCQIVLDLGCGTGNDTLRLSSAGFKVVGLDYSKEGIRQGLTKVGANLAFVVADMAQALPFAPASFEAVMSNVAMHMFSDQITRTLFAEVWRIVQPGGLFLFHLNALEDRPLRAKRIAAVCEFDTNYILEETGQTMHFFSKEYLLDLLAEWREVKLELVGIADQETGQTFKQVWRGIVCH